MARRTPVPIVETLHELRQVGRYLDYVADTTISDDMHRRARVNAIKVWKAIDHVEALARIVEHFAAMLPDPSEIDPHGTTH